MLYETHKVLYKFLKGGMIMSEFNNSKWDATDYELQIGDGLRLADLTEEQKSLLGENFDMYDDETLSWCGDYIYWDTYTMFTGCKKCSIQNLITFEALFNKVPVEAVKEDEPEVEIRPCVKWVTANTSGDVMDVMLGHLTDGRDYKIIEYDSECYHVRDDKGAIERYHKTWFDSPENITTSAPPQPEHIDTGFEGLVYVPPVKDVYLAVTKLSKEQLEWFVVNVPFDSLYGGGKQYLCYNPSKPTQCWYMHDLLHYFEVPTTFNEVFKENK